MNLLPNKTKVIDSITDIKESIGNASLCYGHFNIIHPGHIRYLQYAKSLGSKLCVALIGDRFINIPNQGKFFPQIERAIGLSSLEIVDEVYILDNLALSDFIDSFKPARLIIGSEHKNSPRLDIKNAVKSLEKINRKVVYHAGDLHFSSLDFFHNSLYNIEQERKIHFQQACKRHNITKEGLLGLLLNGGKPNILVIGDTIVDQYIACDALGISAEAPVLVVKELESKEFLGGAAIVAAHIKELGANCSFISVVGCDFNSRLVVEKLNEFRINHFLTEDDSRPTTFKIRYMVENQKLFRVSKLKENFISEEIEEKVINNLKNNIKGLDAIVVSDFVYGLVTKKVLDEIIGLAKSFNVKVYGDLQCSTQVGNVGKFKNFDAIFPTEKEARLSLNNFEDGIEHLSNKLIDQTMTKNLILKMGAEGFVTYSGSVDPNQLIKEHFPALTTNPLDVAGAGDSLMSAVVVSLTKGANIMEASALGACMAALAVQKIGNLPISVEELTQFIRELGIE